VDALSTRPYHSLLRTNNYLTESRNEYFRRIDRGRADDGATRFPCEFDAYQAAEIDSQFIQRFLPALRNRIDERQTSRQACV
jgi:hypothetical protein